MKILIVDDDAVSRLVLEVTLQKLGHEATPCGDASQALVVLKNETFQVIISDLLMPGIDGLELCRRVRAASGAHYTYFIVLTGVGTKSGYLEGMKAGADDFIAKPFDEEMLAARLLAGERHLKLQTQVKQLAGLLPICSLCKRVRDDHNYWHQVESYVQKHTDARFTHSYCPDCFSKFKAQIEALEPVKG
jgi:DNA-binding response OmpR family regulator